jgi:hypothetical protein
MALGRKFHKLSTFLHSKPKPPSKKKKERKKSTESRPIVCQKKGIERIPSQ